MFRAKVTSAAAAGILLGVFVNAGIVAPVLGPSAHAVLLGFGDGKDNVARPSDDPGWDRMGIEASCPSMCRFSYVYLGEGWFISTHLAAVDGVKIVSTGEVYRPASRKPVRLGSKSEPVDIRLFQVKSPPELSLIPISEKTPRQGTDLVMIGAGHSRGSMQTKRGMRGWEAEPPRVLRWGTNRVSDNRVFQRMHLFSARFDQTNAFARTEYESHAVAGDYGGGAFIKNGEAWELAGIIHKATPPFLGGGKTYFVDLSRYRDQIHRIVNADQ